MTARRINRSLGSEASTLPGSSIDEPLVPFAVEGEESDRSALSVEPSRSSIRENVSRTVKSFGAAAQEQVTSVGEDVGAELSKAAEKQKTRGVDGMRAVAGAMDTAAAELAESSPMVAEHVRTASRSVADLSTALEGRDVKELFRTALGLAKDNPALFFAGAMAGGFLISRFLKSSSEG